MRKIVTSNSTLFNVEDGQDLTLCKLCKKLVKNSDIVSNNLCLNCYGESDED